MKILYLAHRLQYPPTIGAVPDVRPYLAKAKVAVAPLCIARGVQNKILEAMAMAIPGVSSSAVFQGIAATERH